MDGFLNINKLVGPTSHDVVRQLKRILGITKHQKLGHTGTLDPSASGVLVICLERANRLAEFVLRHPKEYTGLVRLGELTDTLDSKGKVTESKHVPEFSLNNLDDIIPKFLGRITQTPPAISALKIDGERYYVKARRNEEFEIPSRETTVYDLRLTKEDEKTIRLYVKCASGFYVRSLARDVAQELGTVGHLDELVRTSVGGFKLENAITCDEIETKGYDFAIKNTYPVDFPLDILRKIEISENEAIRFVRGNFVWLEHDDLKPNEQISIYYQNLFLGIGKIKHEKKKVILKPRKVIAKIEEIMG